ncbi:MAG TPA: valine--tRNA ligase [Opitutae bacterium]|nr:valine--tRNA ligase [Opitutae bacterium]|tara:strand:+ start:2124 stop:4856 length:2733 start_codon:yes stop_codon:yes gene_type:complete
MEKAYSPKEVEDRLYKKWLNEGSFSASVRPNKEAYSIVIPPPNVTGVLTMGHVLNNTVQDILARRARQNGKSVLWLPGTDHAGIATQTKVENAIKEMGRTRESLGREQFNIQACNWRDEHGGIILNQLKKLGCSCDWDRNVHTLDEDYSKSVLAAFVKLFKKGYVYRGQRMVNWCPASLTALSDEEVIMKPQSSILYKIRYNVVESPGAYLEICTTRPETIVGDVALAIHPEDPRWKNLQGKHVMRPINPMAIPIIADSAVDREFGTGVLKITPAHDKLDFEISQRHNLPLIEILNADGTLSEAAGFDFAGIDRFAARKMISDKLRADGYLLEEEPYENNVGFSERADVPIEPRLSEQWFLKYPRVEEAKKMVKEGHIKFFPERWEKTYLHWMDNIQDWCISRQLWWGHRIPVWYRKGKVRTDPENWHISVSGPSDPENWDQDEDVLDTWASSWLWPLATLGWPDEQEMEQKGFNYFYPTSVLVTGPDIIFFWVARMIMAGIEFDGRSYKPDQQIPGNELPKRVPFKHVYFTGIIRDGEGKKMSKSLGNSPEPLDLITKYGADGLRHGIMSIAPKGQDIRFSEDRIEQGRNFCNKLWNVSRFRALSGSTSGNQSVTQILSRIQPGQIKDEDAAILIRLKVTIDEVENFYQDYEFNSVLHAIYKFFWSDFCDWYVEDSKKRIKVESSKETCLAIQDFCLREILLLLHPFTPFITEELWTLLGFSDGDSIQSIAPMSGTGFMETIAQTKIELDPNALAEIESVRELVTQLRALKAERNLSNNREVEFFYVSGEECSKLISKMKRSILEAVGAKSLQRIDAPKSGLPAIVSNLGSFYLDLSSGVDVEVEIPRMKKEIDNLEKIILSIEYKLNNEKFVTNAPPKVVEGAKAQLVENRLKLKESTEILHSLSSIS